MTADIQELNFDIKFRDEPPIPPHLREGLRHYIEQHRPTGGCLRAILENDLFGAILLADRETRAALGTIACFLYNEAPAACHGSQEAVAAWLTKGRHHEL